MRRGRGRGTGEAVYERKWSRSVFNAFREWGVRHGDRTNDRG